MNTSIMALLVWGPYCAPQLLTVRSVSNQGPDGPATQISSGEAGPDALDLREGLDGIPAHLAAKPRSLHAAPRGRGVEVRRHVDPDRTGPDLARKAIGGAYVTRPDDGGQSEVGVVGLQGELFRVVIRQDSQYRPKDLFARDPHFLAYP